MRLLHAAAAILLAFAIATAALAQTKLDLQLVLAVDASGSVNMSRFNLQQHGYAMAFRNPSVLQAIQSGTGQAIAVTMVQWTGPALHEQVIGWTTIHDAASAAAFADAIDATPRKLFSGGTSISGAIDYAMTLFPQSAYQGARRVIDVSGDGRNNSGRPAADARDDALAQGVSINALPVLTLEPDLADFYRNNVIGGPGAFVIVVHSYDEFAAAILHKLVSEIATRDRVRQTRRRRLASSTVSMAPSQ